MRSPCPACGAKLRFPPEHQGEVQCPKCQHVFVVGMD
ncbi:MAG: zinc-ribbon domain-containing protein [Poseidonia sp.]